MKETRFTMLLLEAKGNRTNKEFVAQCGIGYNTLLRLYKGETPTIAILKKIARCAENHITFEDLVIEAYCLYLPNHTYQNRTLFTYFSSRLYTLMGESPYTKKELVDFLNIYSNCLKNTKIYRESEIFQVPHRHYSERLLYDFIMQYEQPTLTDLYVISRIFEVSLDYLLGVTDIKTPFVENVTYNSKDLADPEIEKKFLENYKQLPQDERNYLFALSKALIDHYQ